MSIDDSFPKTYPWLSFDVLLLALLGTFLLAYPDLDAETRYMIRILTVCAVWLFLVAGLHALIVIRHMNYLAMLKTAKPSEYAQVVSQRANVRAWISYGLFAVRAGILAIFTYLLSTRVI
jgi:hypothetical protein